MMVMNDRTEYCSSLSQARQANVAPPRELGKLLATTSEVLTTSSLDSLGITNGRTDV